jgi:30S ribosomal protein S31
MGKGDKKTKRGKIVIGSSGVKRSRKKKNAVAIKPKAEPKPLKEAEEVVAPAAKAAAKKTAKKADEHAEGAEEKHKAAKAKKKTAENETEPAEEETQQEEPKQD